MSANDVTYHYHPDLLALLIDTIPLLCRSKKDVLQFFRSSGVSEDLTGDLAAQLAANRDAVKKHHMTRTVLARLNEKGEAALRERREVLRRVVVFEDFSTCWPEDQLKARGLVAAVQKLVAMKDSATRIQSEVEESRSRRRAAAEQEARQLRERQASREAVKTNLFKLFAEPNPWRRGKALESVLNELFRVEGVLVREAFTLTGDEGQGIIEQIDGVIELDGNLFLVEMKWWNQKMDPGDVSQHMIRVFNRRHVRGLLIAHPGFTEAAVLQCKDSLQQAVFVLCELEEIVRLLTDDGSLREMLRAKVHAAMLDKQPLFRGWLVSKSP